MLSREVRESLESPSVSSRGVRWQPSPYWPSDLDRVRAKVTSKGMKKMMSVVVGVVVGDLCVSQSSPAAS